MDVGGGGPAGAVHIFARADHVDLAADCRRAVAHLKSVEQPRTEIGIFVAEGSALGERGVKTAEPLEYRPAHGQLSREDVERRQRSLDLPRRGPSPDALGKE